MDANLNRGTCMDANCKRSTCMDANAETKIHLFSLQPNAPLPNA